MKLYNELASVYEAIYPKLFNYEKEFQYYHQKLQEFSCLNVIEIGCGPGFLAKEFVNYYYTYLGVDISEDMLELAHKRVPTGNFIKGDMRNLRIHQTFDAVLITGKTFDHLLTNADIFSCLESINRLLRPQGLLLFDCFNATFLFTHFQNNVEDSFQIGENNYKRFATNTPVLSTGFTWQWDVKYFIQLGSNKSIVQDSMQLRAFTRDEIDLILQLGRFEPLTSDIAENDPSQLKYIAFKK
jgi:SAM-dependent methyltransferase